MSIETAANLPEAANKRQKNQWILQSLGFMDSDNFNQVGIAFQPDNPFATGLAALGFDSLSQIPD